MPLWRQSITHSTALCTMTVTQPQAVQNPCFWHISRHLAIVCSNAEAALPRSCTRQVACNLTQGILPQTNQVHTATTTQLLQVMALQPDIASLQNMPHSDQLLDTLEVKKTTQLAPLALGRATRSTPAAPSMYSKYCNNYCTALHTCAMHVSASPPFFHM
jgi:hypothetical protein